MPSQSELDEFLSRLGDQRARLMTAQDDPADAGREIAGLVEELLVADEELRAQHDELAAVRLELDRMWARHEELFGPSAMAYVITDPRGIVVDANRAAWGLLGHPARPRTRRPIATMFPAGERRTVRRLISLAAVSGEPQTADMTMTQGDHQLELRVSVEVRTEPQSGAALLRWQLSPLAADKETPLLRLVSSDTPATDDAGVGPGGELARLLSLARSNLAAELSADDGPDAMLDHAVELTRRWVPGTEHASVAVRLRPDVLHITATTGEIASACDQIQADLAQGPVFDALADHATVRVDDLGAETRWPDFARRALELDLRSVLVCELPMVAGSSATLNLYSSKPAAFGPMAELVAPVFASRASIALAHHGEVYNLRRAIDSRQMIGQAIGILMERHKITSDEAFDRLVRASQCGHMKLRELATRVVETGEEPDLVT